MNCYFISVKNNYYRLALVYHPDRAIDTEKETAKEKFNILHQAYSVLVNSSTRKIYDDGDQRILFANSNASLKWDSFIKPISDSEIETQRKQYQGSTLEENDIIREIIAGKGSITHLLNTIPYMRVEDEERVTDIVKCCMVVGKVPKMSIRKIR